VRARERIDAAGLRAVCRCGEAYPERLRELPDPPAVLHIAGDPAALADAAPSHWSGRGAARPTALEVAAGSGTRFGPRARPSCRAWRSASIPPPTSAPAGRAARVVAVLAGGADRPYPAQNRALYRQVVERGCVVSELPPGVGPHRWAFVARNRVIAGLAAMTVVVEATERSGSLTTADFAAQVGRAVGAVPGR
jgi:DNA processing protein